MLRLIRQRYSIYNECHWARDAQLGDDAHRSANWIGAMGIHLPANGGDLDKSAEAIPAARRLPLRPPRLWRAGLRHQRDAGTGRGENGRDYNSIHTFKQPCRGVKNEHGSFQLNRPWRVDSKFGDTATKLLKSSNGSFPINI